MQIRELLEKLLDDDDDMRDMNLAAKCACREFLPPALPPVHLSKRVRYLVPHCCVSVDTCRKASLGQSITNRRPTCKVSIRSAGDP